MSRCSSGFCTNLQERVDADAEYRQLLLNIDTSEGKYFRGDTDYDYSSKVRFGYDKTADYVDIDLQRDVYVFARSLNVLKISSGMGGLAFK